MNSSNLNNLIFEHMLLIKLKNTSWVIARKWMPQNTCGDKFRKWLGIVTKPAITWADIHPDRCRHTASLSRNELKPSGGIYLVSTANVRASYDLNWQLMP